MYQGENFLFDETSNKIYISPSILMLLYINSSHVTVKLFVVYSDLPMIRGIQTIFPSRDFSDCDTLPSIKLRLLVSHFWWISDGSIYRVRDIRKIRIGTNASARTRAPRWSILRYRFTIRNTFAPSKLISGSRSSAIGVWTTSLRALFGSHFQVSWSLPNLRISARLCTL